MSRHLRPTAVVLTGLTALAAALTSCSAATNGSALALARSGTPRFPAGSGQSARSASSANPAKSPGAPGFPSTPSFPSTQTPSTNTPSTNTPSTPAAPTGSGTTARPLTNAQLSNLLLQPADFPPGVQSQAGGTDSNSATLDACVGTRNTEPDHVGKVVSPTFVLADHAIVSSDAESFRAQDDVSADVATFDNTKFPKCAAIDIRSSALQEFPNAAVSARVDVRRGSSGGPSDVIGTITADVVITRNGQNSTIHEASALIAGRLVEAEVDFVGVNRTPPTSDIAKYATLIADRVAKA